MMTPDIVVKDNKHLIELHKSGGLKGYLIEVPSFLEDGEPILINLSGRLRFTDSDASKLIEYIEQNYLARLKKALVELSLYCYQNRLGKSDYFPLLSTTGNSTIDKWLTSYAAKSPVKNRKSVRGYIFSLEPDEVSSIIRVMIDELLTFDAWADAISEEAMAKLGLDLYPAFLLSRKKAINKMKCRNLAVQLSLCIRKLADVKKKRSLNNLISEMGGADTLLIFSEEHLDVTRRRKSSIYRNIYLKILSCGITNKLWIPRHSKRAPRLQFRAIASDAIEDAIEQSFSQDRKSILTSMWSRIVICSSIGQTLNFPIQIRILGDYLLNKNLSGRAGYRKIMEQLNRSHDLGYPLEMCDTIHKQGGIETEQNWYDRYSMVDRDGVLSVEANASLSAGDVTQPLPDEWLTALKIYHELKLTSDGYKSDCNGLINLEGLIAS